ncbi:MAG: SGNH/GDSL hydrolase family protein [Planctomycetaceae bacterium]
MSDQIVSGAAMKTLCTLSLLTLTFAGSACRAEPAFPLQANRILFLGDSITHSGQYVAAIETQLRLQQCDPLPEIIGLGLSSETCSGLSEPGHPFPRPNVHERLDRALEKIKPDVVVACYGMNDGIYHPFSEERFAAYQAGVHKLIDQIHAAGAKVVVVTPPPFDPVPLANKPNKLLPEDSTGYGYQGIYDRYDDVLKRYGQWIMKDLKGADLVVDTHSAVTEVLNQKRKTDPQFTVAGDGIHPNSEGHDIIAGAILKAWGVESWEEPSAELRKLANQKQSILHDAWLSEVGHLRPGVKAGLPLKEAQETASRLAEQIQALVESAIQPATSEHASSNGTVYSVHYPASLKPGALRLAVDYHLWIPQSMSRVRGIIVHQHGCGTGASIGGQTAADDLHWQALAEKHQCALMGSSYEPREGVNCRLWCDARSGSADRFLQSLSHFSERTAMPEIADVPWCLWGHSGGGFWSSLMQTLYPQRIVAIWLQSGTAFGYWKKGDIPEPSLTEAVYSVPVLANPGLKERDDKRFHVAYDGSKAMQENYLQHGAAFFEFAADPKTGHECGDSRYLSIRFFDFWLSQRLAENSADLKPVTAEVQAAWKQNLAGLQQEFTETGVVNDVTPPPAPTNVVCHRLDDGSVHISWSATADFESGLRGFEILRNNEMIGTLPEKPVSRFGRPLFQGLSYHDTPEAPLPVMEFVDRSAPTDRLPQYQVIAVNSVELKSEPTSSGR